MRKSTYTILIVLSFACYWLWTFAVLISKLIPQHQSSSVFEDSWFWSTLGHIAALLIMIALARFYAPFGTRKAITISTPFICLAGYLLVLYSSFTQAGSFPCVLLGAVLTGVGNAGLLVCWCEAYTAGYRGDQSRFYVAAGILLSIVLFFLLTLLHSIVLEFVLATFPFVTMATTQIAGRKVGQAEEECNEENLTFSPYFAIFCLVYALPLGFFQMYFIQTSDGLPANWLTVLAPSFVLIAIFLVVDILLIKKFKTSALAKIIIPVAIAGLLLLSIFDTQGVRLGGILIYSSQQFMAIFFYGLFASMSANGRAIPAKTFATGIVFIDGGYVIGQLIAEISQNFFAGLAVELTLGVVYLAAIVGVFMFPRISEAVSKSRQDQELNKSEDAQKESAQTISATIHLGKQSELQTIADRYRLTARESDMLYYLACGKSVPAIARETFLSQNTVKTHISHIYQKLDVHSRDELLTFIENTLSSNNLETS